MQVVVALTDGGQNEVLLTKDVLLPTHERLMDVLQRNNNTSIFYEMLHKHQHERIFKVCLFVQWNMYVRLSAL